MANNFRFKGTLEFDDTDIQIITGSVDPSAGAGVAAEIGSLYLRNTGDVWKKEGAADTAWRIIDINVLDHKDSVRAATTAALADAYTYDNGSSGVGATLTKTSNGAFPAVDGITLAAGESVLIKNETGANAPYNGIYVVTTVGDGSNPWVLTRREDNDQADEFASASTFVEEGTDNANRKMLCTTTESITVGTTDIAWQVYSALEYLVAGAGLTKNGDTIDIGDPDKGVQVNADDIEVDASEVAGDGTEQDGVSSWKLKVKAGDSGAANLADVISVESQGISVKIDETSVKENASNQLEVIGFNNNISADNQDPSSGLTGDQVALTDCWAVKWFVVVRSTSTPANREAVEVYALHDGTSEVDYTIYAQNGVTSSVNSLSYDVDISGGNMRLRITAAENIDYRITRICVPA